MLMMKRLLLLGGACLTAVMVLAGPVSREQALQKQVEAKEQQDSVGGAIECAVWGLPAGLERTRLGLQEYFISLMEEEDRK